MRCALLAGLVLAAAMSSGCLVLSLQPVYDDDSIAFDEALIGQWENAEDQTSATIEQAQWRSYKVSFTDRSATRTFQGNLTKIAAARYLDLTETRGNDFGPYLVPVHGLIKVALVGDTLTAADLDYGWFIKAMTRKLLGRLSVSTDDRRNVVIASPAADLRRWLTTAPAEAFGAPMTFTRQHSPGVHP